MGRVPPPPKLNMLDETLSEIVPSNVEMADLSGYLLKPPPDMAREIVPNVARSLPSIATKIAQSTFGISRAESIRKSALERKKPLSTLS